MPFVKSHGQIPPDARRITDEEAVTHPAPWIRRNLGVGTASGYVVGFASGDSWWTLFFDRLRDLENGVEVWKVDSHDSRGRSWERRFWYWPDGRWQQMSPRDATQSAGDSEPAGH